MAYSHISSASYFPAVPACQIILLAPDQGPGSLEAATTKAVRLLSIISVEVSEHFGKNRSASGRDERLGNFYYIPVFQENQAEAKATLSRSLGRIKHLVEGLESLEAALQGQFHSSSAENAIVFASIDEGEIRDFVSHALGDLNKWKKRSDLRTACALTAALLCVAGGGLVSFFTEKSIYGFGGAIAFLALVLKSRSYIFDTQSPFTAFFNEIAYNLNVNDLPAIAGHPFREPEAGEFLSVHLLLESGHHLDMVYSNVNGPSQYGGSPKLVFSILPKGHF